MTDDEVNARIAELLGYRWVVTRHCAFRDRPCRRMIPMREGAPVEVWDGEEDIGTCDNEGLGAVPNYCGDLNATMALIEERWPSADVRIGQTYASIWIRDRGGTTAGHCHWTGYRAELLACALLGALEAEIGV